MKSSDLQNQNFKNQFYISPILLFLVPLHVVCGDTTVLAARFIKDSDKGQQVQVGEAVMANPTLHRTL